MRTSFFLRKVHPYILAPTILAIVILYILTSAVLIALVWPASGVSGVGAILALVLITAVAVILIRFICSIGLYIEGPTIYYKGLKKKWIDIYEIVGIKVEQAYGYHTYKGLHPLKTPKGEFLYSAIFLNSLTDEMHTHHGGDLWFFQEFRKHTICLTIYKKEAIDYLKTLNPRIRII